MQDRLGKVRGMLDAENLGALLVTDELNVRYLSGFTGSAGGLLVTRDDSHLLTDPRFTEQAAEECPGFEVDSVPAPWTDKARFIIRVLQLLRVGFEAGSLSYRDWDNLCQGSIPTKLIPLDDPVTSLRWIKDKSEIQAIREAAQIIDLTYEQIKHMLKPGLQEREVALQIDFLMRKHGANKEGFDTIVISGPRCSLPHGCPTDRRIADGDLIVMDFGASWKGYHSDITRTVVLGEPDARQTEIYEIVFGAQTRAIAAIRPGIPGGKVDAVARDYITSRGYGENFGHGLGHGLGLAVHDGRILARESEIVLQAGMVVTVEPGIYIPGWGGVRIEDDVLITDSGCEVLTHASKGLSLARG
jgi:Xaa-Pro aminopeptidase